jgi:hypothetical protein
MSPGVWIALAMAALAPQAQLAAPDPPVHLRVGVYTYNADGSLAGSASGTADEGGDAANIVWVAMGATSCGAGAGMLPSRPDATAWKWTGRILGQSGTGYLVQVKEGRVTGAAGETWPRAEHNAMVSMGGWAVLDEVSATVGPCSGRIARLEARVEPAVPPRAPVIRGAGGAATGVRAGGVSNVPRAAASTGVGSPSGGGAAGSRMLVDPSPSEFLSNNLDYRGDRNTERSLLTETTAAGDQSVREVDLHSVPSSYRAEMWLVHTAPDGTQRTESRIGRIDDAGAVFRFTLLPVRLADGPASVLIGINLRPMATADGRPMLRAEIARVLDGKSQGAQGATSRAVPMPHQGDVVSFELPTLPFGMLDGHRFELRVRLTPAS